VLGAGQAAKENRQAVTRAKSKSTQPVAGQTSFASMYPAAGRRRRKLAIDLAASHRLPAIYGIPDTGCLVYFLDIRDHYRNATGAGVGSQQLLPAPEQLARVKPSSLVTCPDVITSS
jgi:hypothetical protein